MADTIGPTVTVTRNGAATTNASAVTYTVTFSEVVTGVTTNSFTIATTGNITGASVTDATEVNDSGTTYTVTVGTGTGEGTLALVVTGAGVKDADGNGLQGRVFESTVGKFGVGDEPQAMTVGDLDGDGDLDLAVANWASNDISVLLNDGSGRFAPATNVSLGPSDPFSNDNPFEIAAGDIDGDGDLDLAVANYNGTRVSVLPNDGSGGFGSVVEFSMGLKNTSVALADVDGDDDLDLLATTEGSRRVEVSLNDGSGNFGSRSGYHVGGNAPYGLALGDLDGDGDLDAATSNLTSDDVSVLLNNGSGAFGAATRYPTGDGAASVALGDLEGDGDLDLVVANLFGDTVSVLRNVGLGVFAPATNYTTIDRPTEVSLSDLDNNGDLDISVSHTGVDGDNASVLLNDGSGAFGAATNFAGVAYDVALADVNSDGKTDLIGVSGEGSEGEVFWFASVRLNGPAPVTGDAFTVDRPPVAQPDTVTLDEDSSATGNVIQGEPGGAGQDSDPGGQSLTVTAVSGSGGAGTVGQPLTGSFGVLTLNADGSFSYTPNEAAQALNQSQTATDVFDYTVSDGTNTASTMLTFTITGSDEGFTGGVFTGGSEGDYVLSPNDGPDQLDGGGGDDHLDGAGGDDRAFGGEGSDSLLGGDGSDHLDGGEGEDRTYGGTDKDGLIGGEGNDRLEGEAGDDNIYGGEGNDGLIGGEGNDRIEGDAGNDVLLGGSGDDGLIGGEGGDILEGEAGNDVLLGEGGADLLTGGVGDDLLDGGTGTDGFIFAPGFGKDIITSFEGGPGAGDNIRFDPALFGGGVADFAAVLARAADDGAGNVIITFDANTQLSLVGITKAQLAADDFSFA